MVKKIIKIVIISSAIILFMDYANYILNDAETIYPESVSYRVSINSTEGVQDLNTTNWKKGVPIAPGVGWLKATFHFTESYSSKRELMISFLGPYELYWEGVLIGENGRVSFDPKNELPGSIDNKYILPDSLIKKGRKELLLRYSDHKNIERHQLAVFSIDPYNENFKRSQAQSILIYSLAGIFLIVSVYYFFLYYNSFRNLAFLLFALLCITSFILLIYVYSDSYYPYSYLTYHLRQSIIEILSLIIVLLLPMFYLFHFGYPKKRAIIFAIPVLLISLRLMPEYLSWIYFTSTIIAPLYFVIWALIKGKRGSIEALVGLIVFVYSFMYLNISVYAGFAVLIISTLFSLSIILGIERKKHEESILRSSRLESQLLKKNIQPHFLMNTLTNIISLIETNPKLSIKLIEALSDEFYAMIDIADKKLITIEKEVELCKAHLDIMGIRNDVSYKLSTSKIDVSRKIPPAIFHTLIENGLTHNSPINGKLSFHLAELITDNSIIYTLNAFGRVSSKDNTIKDGTGLKYVKSRLEESFPGRWTFDSNPTNFGWETRITLVYENINS